MIRPVRSNSYPWALSTTDPTGWVPGLARDDSSGRQRLSASNARLPATPVWPALPV